MNDEMTRLEQVRLVSHLNAKSESAEAVGSSVTHLQTSTLLHTHTVAWCGFAVQALPDAISALAPGGRLAVISFHSLEDRIVKRAFAHACGKPTAEDEHQLYGPNKFAFLDELEARAVAKAVTRKPVVPDADECALNPRSRSSKLRVIQRL